MRVEPNRSVLSTVVAFAVALSIFGTIIGTVVTPPVGAYLEPPLPIGTGAWPDVSYLRKYGTFLHVYSSETREVDTIYGTIYHVNGHRDGNLSSLVLEWAAGDHDWTQVDLHSPSVAAGDDFWVIAFGMRNTATNEYSIGTCTVDYLGGIKEAGYPYSFTCDRTRTESVQMLSPRVGADTAQGKFLVVWNERSGFGGGWEVKGQFYNAASHIFSDKDFTILATPAAVGKDKSHPAINQQGNGFLVVAEKKHSEFENRLEARYVRPDGRMEGPFELEATQGTMSFDPQVAAGSADGNFVVTWRREGPHKGVAAAVLSRTKQIRQDTLVDIGNPEFKPSVTYSGHDRTYLLSYWKVGDNDGVDVWARSFDTDFKTSKVEYVGRSDGGRAAPRGSTIGGPTGDVVLVWDKGARVYSILPKPPRAFTKIAPGPGAKGLKTNLVLQWDASYGATDYEYCVDTTND